MRWVIRSLLLGMGILILAACSLPGSHVDQGPLVAQQAATIVAETMKAAVPSAMAAMATPFASPIAPAATPTSKPTLFINTDKASCRSGPGHDFKVIAAFASGTTVDLVGRDSPDNYWIVIDPATRALCWVQVQDATPGGSFDSLPEMTPQAPSVSVPGKPGTGSWNFSCDNTTLTTILGWSAPPGTSVNGYRIYRKGTQIADVPSSQTSYTETVPFTYGGSMTYSVSAYNDAGASPERVWNIHCP